MTTHALKNTPSVIDAILSVFETGKIPSPESYGTVAVLSDGAGISYGKHQCTDHSGTLDAVVMRYIDLNGVYASELTPYLSKLSSDESTNIDPKNPESWVVDLMGILKKAGSTDILMQRAQDEVFTRLYWAPAVGYIDDLMLSLELSWAVIYDTCIQSGPARVATMRQLFPELPPSKGGNERAWTTAYILARRQWLASKKNPVVQKTVYRMDAFLKIIKEDNWNLVSPLTVRNVKIV